jgi:hypothetical protein
MHQYISQAVVQHSDHICTNIHLNVSNAVETASRKSCRPRLLTARSYCLTEAVNVSRL